MDDGLPPLREVIARHGMRAKKSLGQNFLLDLNLTGKIARAAGPLPGYDIIEVGPGPGGLTRALLNEGADRVIAIERDERALGALEEISTVYPGRLTIVAGDALSVEWNTVVERPARIAANLPYNIATALLVQWLTSEPWPPWFTSATVMFQREVADRIIARHGNKSFGRLSVLSQWRTSAERVFDINPRAFHPVPSVHSSLVRIEPRPSPRPFSCQRDALERVTAAAFGQRRKMLRSSLKALKQDPEPLLAAAGLAGTLRAEQLDVDDFVRLAAVFGNTPSCSDIVHY